MNYVKPIIGLLLYLATYLIGAIPFVILFWVKLELYKHFSYLFVGLILQYIVWQLYYKLLNRIYNG